MSELSLRGLAIVALAFVAVADAGPAQPASRVVLADPDPELRRAVEAALRPWHLEIVVVIDRPTDIAAAQTRADVRTARFVVWREADELVVYDRDLGVLERRPAKAGTFDAVGAAAAALTVKTMMRLPPPPPAPVTAPDEAVTAPAQPAAIEGVELRLQAGSIGRYEHGLDGNLALRFELAAAVRPWRAWGWRFGALVDVGAAAQVVQAGFHGSWSNWGALALASWTLPRGTWELEPWLALGLEHSLLDGNEAGTPRIETATLVAVRGGLAVRYALGRWRLGVIAGGESLPVTRTYTKLAAPAPVFEIPGIGVIAGVMVTTDMSP